MGTMTFIEARKLHESIGRPFSFCPHLSDGAVYRYTVLGAFSNIHNVNYVTVKATGPLGLLEAESLDSVAY